MDAPVSRARNVSTYCYQCVAGPDLLTVRVEDGTATEIGPNFTAAEIHPAGGKVCVKAFGLVQKAYNPHRVLYPMKRTNPDKGRNEDPGFVRISWNEALDLVAAKLNKVRAVGLLDEAGFPRVAARCGGGGTPTAYMGTLPALLAAWGPVDMSFGSGQGVKCYHSEHLYGELWHRAFTVSPDTPLCEYLVSFGANVEASVGVCGVKRHADARASARAARPAVPEAPQFLALSDRPGRVLPARSAQPQAVDFRLAQRTRGAVRRGGYRSGAGRLLPGRRHRGRRGPRDHASRGRPRHAGLRASRRSREELHAVRWAS